MDLPKISLGSWAFSFGSFRSAPWSFERLIRYAAQAGYDGVEINGFRPHPHPDEYNTPARCRELKAQIQDLGLGISAYAPDFETRPPAEVEPGVYLDVLDQCIRFCTAMGIGRLRIDTVSPPMTLSRDEYERRFQHLASTWRMAADRCKAEGILLVWEFEPGFWLNKPGEVLRMSEAVNHSHFKLLFDTSHAYMGAVVGARHCGESETLPGGVAEYARMLGDHIGHLHLIDSDGSLHDNATSTHFPFGEGKVDFVEVLNALKPTLYQLPWWCVDFCFWPNGEVDAKKAVPYVRQLMIAVMRAEG